MQKQIIVGLVVGFILGFGVWVPFLYNAYELLPYSFGFTENAEIYGNVRVPMIGWTLKPQYYSEWASGYPLVGSSQSILGYLFFYLPYTLSVVAVLLWLGIYSARKAKVETA